ncbi:MAG TPA: mannonate dehydratase [Candidatus Limnocylindria bacterium]|nr:mannonate dehydratase [Candidatus Limnocylindria bacterium]
MKMTMRWFGDKFDTVKLWQIRQVPGVVGVISTLYDALPGEDWDAGAVAALKAQVEEAGLQLLGIESVNVHDAIKAGHPNRDRYIENYVSTLRKLGELDIHMVCYNFMPVFDWVRSDLAHVRPDGSFTFYYDQAEIDKVDPELMSGHMNAGSKGFPLPGWEPERMARIRDLFETYRGLDEGALLDNLCYFLRAVMPVCDRYDINMAIHIDDPAWSVFGLPRIVTDGERIRKILRAVDNPHNGVTLCTGSLSTNPQNDIPAVIRSLKGRIHFAHVRNTRHHAPGVFEEAAHYAADGSLDMVEIMRALLDVGFDGPIRPDHGRAIWGEVSLPGYGLYDRALGTQYLLGILDALTHR